MFVTTITPGANRRAELLNFSSKEMIYTFDDNEFIFSGKCLHHRTHFVHVTVFVVRTVHE